MCHDARNEPVFCAYCGQDLDLSLSATWINGCPVCGCKYVVPKRSFRPTQMLLFPRDA